MTIKVYTQDKFIHETGDIESGEFEGIWHFNFSGYSINREHFGTLRVFNDDTLSEGATWPLHPHRHNEVVSYIPQGAFRHEDENGKASEVLYKGGVQHTTIGRGMWHAEINDSEDEPLRFVQIWFIPEELGLDPGYEQRNIEKSERTNKLLPLVSKDIDKTLPIRSDARVWSSFLQKDHTLEHEIKPYKEGEIWGVYLFNVEGYPLLVNGKEIPERGSAEITELDSITIESTGETEILLLDVRLDAPYIRRFIRGTPRYQKLIEKTE